MVGCQTYGLFAIVLLLATLPSSRADLVTIDLSSYPLCRIPVISLACDIFALLDDTLTAVDDVVIHTGEEELGAFSVLLSTSQTLNSLTLSANIGASLAVVIKAGISISLSNLSVGANTSLHVSGDLFVVIETQVVGEIIVDAAITLRAGLNLGANASLTLSAGAQADISGLVNITGKLLADAEAVIRFSEANIYLDAQAIVNNTITLANHTYFAVLSGTARAAGFVVQGINNTIYALEGAAIEINGALNVADKAVLALAGNVTAKADAFINGTIAFGQAAAAYVEFEAGFLASLASNISIQAGTVISKSFILLDRSSFFIGNWTASGFASFSGSLHAGDNTTVQVVPWGSLVLTADSVLNGTLSLLRDSAFVVKSGVTQLKTDLVAFGNTTVSSVLALVNGATAYAHLQGNLFLSDGSLVIAANVTIGASAILRGLFGNASVQGSLYISGTVSITNVLNINANLVLDVTANFIAQLASAANYSHILVGGSAHHAGSLNVTLADGYSPVVNTSFPIIVFGGSGGGNFSSVPPSYSVTYDAGKTSLKVSSSPSSTTTSSSPSPLPVLTILSGLLLISTLL